MEISVKVRRQASRESLPTYQTYTVEADPNTSTVLDILHKIQWDQDGSLGFRRNCRNVICGSCSMRVNGKAGLACQKLVSEVFASIDRPTLLIEPMGNLPVIKDLIVDMTKFWQKSIRMFLLLLAKSLSKPLGRNFSKRLPNAINSNPPLTASYVVLVIPTVMLLPSTINLWGRTRWQKPIG